MSARNEPDPLLGRFVADGRYEILGPLGHGGMGTVYRARQHPLGRMVALKVIHLASSLEPEMRERFQREMRVTSAIEHPHTVRVYDYGMIDERPFLAMEYIEGRTLRSLLERDGTLAPERIVPIALQVAKALRAAHEAGIVHRDLKPENIMLSDRYGDADFVKVLDFGIARPVHDHAGFRTTASVIVGTPEYMSPEHAHGAQLDGRSDLYALGIILYELLTGTPPFTSSSPTALLIAQVTQPPAPLQLPSGRAPGALGELTMRLLAKQPEARPASAGVLIDELMRVAHAPTDAGLATPESVAHSDRPASHGAATDVITPLPTFAQADEKMAERAAPPGAGRALARGRMLVFGSLALGMVSGLGVVAHYALDSKSHAAATPAVPPAASAQVATTEKAELAQEPAWPASCRVGESWLAEARTQVADPAAALNAANRAAFACPQSAVAHQLVGSALQKLKRGAEAERAYREALRLAPDYAAPLFNLGLLHLQRGEDRSAQTVFDRVLDGAPDHPSVLLVRAEAKRRLGDGAGALADLEAQVQAHPELADGWFQLARALASVDARRSGLAFCRASALGREDAAASCLE